MRCFQQFSLCLVIALAISLTALCGCDLGTYSKRSTDYLETNPGGVKKKVKKVEKVEESEETSSMNQHAKHRSLRA